VFKIGDFSKLGQVSVRMLRHYDQLGLLKPGQVDRWTGYRYYTLEQLARLNRIVALNGLGLTLQQIADLLDQNDALPVDRLRGMLTMRRVALEQELQEKALQLASVEARLRQIELEGKPSPYEIVVKSLEPVAVASLRQVAPTISAVGYYCEHLYQSLYERLDEAGITPLSPEITLYHSQEYREIDLDMETAVVVEPGALRRGWPEDQFNLYELPAVETAASLIYEGPFEGLEQPVLALLGWIAECGRVPAGPLRELHLSGRAHENGQPQANPVIELQAPARMVEEGEA
jgi:DNA-binding transcriptional MerR regulator